MHGEFYLVKYIKFHTEKKKRKEIKLLSIHTQPLCVDTQ